MTIIQKPNKELIITLLGFGVSMISSGTVHILGLVTGYFAGAIWSYLELVSGVNWFRKLLGFVVMVYLAYSLFLKL